MLDRCVGVKLDMRGGVCVWACRPGHLRVVMSATRSELNPWGILLHPLLDREPVGAGSCEERFCHIPNPLVNREHL